MDYEEIVYNCSSYSNRSCYLDCPESLGWDRGEVIEIELPIYGGFYLEDNNFISIPDFMGNVSTKSVKMVLKDSTGEEVDIQRVSADSKEMYYSDNHISCYYSVDEKLSKKLIPGSYNLFVYIQNIIPFINSEFPERTIFNKMVTSPEGLEITIY
jgi:hypothetical protein